jgi:hypothetical protein
MLWRIACNFELKLDLLLGYVVVLSCCVVTFALFALISLVYIGTLLYVD